MLRRSIILPLAIFAAVLVFRLCHLDVLWVDEAYALAAAQRVLGGEALYRDIWFDKPPLYAWVYLLWGAKSGWATRLGGALFAVLCAWLAGRAARRLFSGERRSGADEALCAALLTAFFLVFDHPVATVPLAPDLLTLPFALGAVWAIASGRGMLAGALVGAAIHVNAKALLLLPVILAWHPALWGRALAGFATAVTAGLGVLAAQGALTGYWQQVWSWGMLYSQDSPLSSPVLEGARRTLNWLGFHAALVAGGTVYWWKRRDRTSALLALWALLALASVAAGGRFFPRYYFALLPVLILAASKGLMLMSFRARIVLLAALLSVPAVRFGSRHVMLASETLSGRAHVWADLEMERDSRAAAGIIGRLAKPGDSLFVWGYRPEVNVLAGMRAANRFMDSQPLTGVLADRHLTSSIATAPEIAAANRAELAASAPDFVVDGLGPYNRALAISAFPDLKEWLGGYEVAARTSGTLIYRRKQATLQETR